MTEYDPTADGQASYDLAIAYMRHTTAGRDCSFNGGTCRDPDCFEQCKEIRPVQVGVPVGNIVEGLKDAD